MTDLELTMNTLRDIAADLLNVNEDASKKIEEAADLLFDQVCDESELQGHLATAEQNRLHAYMRGQQ